MQSFEEIKEELIKAYQDHLLYGHGLVFFSTAGGWISVERARITEMLPDAPQSQIREAFFDFASLKMDVDTERRRTNAKGPRDRWGRV